MVNDECCDEPTEDCTSGRPSTCNLGCAHVLLPFFDDCASTLGTAATALFDDVVALCRVAEKTDLSSPPPPPHPMRSDVGAPGLYANYDWPQNGLPSPDMEVDHVWTTIPDGSNNDGNGVFASSQYWYESYGQPCPNRSDHGMSCNSAGYMGSQVCVVELNAILLCVQIC
eukprot:SAG31_NODE_18541_length_632_cov_1.362101_1_plen_170_part_10